MAVFKSSEDLHNVMNMLWQRISMSPQMAESLCASRLVVQFRYREPEGLVTIDCSDGNTMKVITGPTTLKPIIEMTMKADVAHDFWRGKVNVPAAIMLGKIASRGPTPKALALLPIIKPAFSLYPEILEDAGILAR